MSTELMRSYLDLLNEKQQNITEGPDHSSDQQKVLEASGNSAKMARVAKMCARQANKDTDNPDGPMYLKAAQYFAAGDEKRGLQTIERMDTEARDHFYMGCEDAGIPVPTDDGPSFLDSLPDLELTPDQKKIRRAMHRELGLKMTRQR